MAIRKHPALENLHMDLVRIPPTGLQQEAISIQVEDTVTKRQDFFSKGDARNFAHYFLPLPKSTLCWLISIAYALHRPFSTPVE